MVLFCLLSNQRIVFGIALWSWYVIHGWLFIEPYAWVGTKLQNFEKHFWDSWLLSPTSIRHDECTSPWMVWHFHHGKWRQLGWFWMVVVTVAMVLEVIGTIVMEDVRVIILVYTNLTQISNRRNKPQRRGSRSSMCLILGICLNSEWFHVRKQRLQ